MRYRAIISYLGTPYVGWQKQLNGLSVQEELEVALTKTFGVVTSATASGRTDAGVHAERQVVHFDAETSIPINKIPFAVNSELPRTVSVLSCEVVDSDFNARFSAKRKTYCYKIYLSQHIRPLLENTHCRIVQSLNVFAMKEAAKLIEGTHDFKCFEASGSVIKNTVRTIYSLDIKTTSLDNGLDVDRNSEKKNFLASDNTLECDQDFKFNSIIEISVCGNGFLYNMVRIIAGTLVYVGLNKLSNEDVLNIIATGDRKKAGKTLPPEGLHLISVQY